MKIKSHYIQHPVLKSYSSENYSLILEDSAGVTHYFAEDGYDGWSHDPDKCIDTRTR
jgi:hypothetical protein